MALKTVTKLHLNSGEAPLSIEMQTAIESDLSIVREDGAITYPDNEHKLPSIAEVSADKEKARVIEHINSLTTIEQLQAFRDTAKANGCETELNDKILSI
jgi:recombinational DNA repair protein RecT